jgi:hypothetical protein
METAGTKKHIAPSWNVLSPDEIVASKKLQAEEEAEEEDILAYAAHILPFLWLSDETP